ncbi:hypothetical protein V1506DRAFT_165113 [Lipomyces tetrasporus]
MRTANTILLFRESGLLRLSLISWASIILRGDRSFMKAPQVNAIVLISIFPMDVSKAVQMTGTPWIAYQESIVAAAKVFEKYL